ncbi:hypothetical protein [Pedobacter sp. SL55]|uniref:hypothetical protein n=1 Tax=Pedobacter sp. SL55 TaxID=2995161 RepID=UPI00226F8CED|nr:hypothetical protein [Pedobacter sp. SL55]WAC40535.1 hypothetical protein OVA16_18515 [Pedobacter sp. SL55]
MKKILKTLLFCFLAIAIIVGCKKNDFSDIGEGTVEAKEYTFNRATKTFDLGDELKSNIAAAEGVKFVYCYLQRTDKTDSLIHVTDNKGVISPTYELAIPIAAFPVNNMSTVKGVKVLVKQGNNSSLEGFVPIKYLDPALPQFSAFPATINANLNGLPTAITATIKSEFGIKQVDILDDYQTENTYVLVNSITGIANVKEYVLNYAYTYRKAAQHIKIRATDIYNQTNEQIIDMPVDVSIFKPRFENFSTTIVPNTTGTTAITGLITSITGLKQVKIYDDYQGAYVEIADLNSLNNTLSYSFNYAYTFRKRAQHLKLIAIDKEDLQTEFIITLDYSYGSFVYRDVVMSAQGTASAGSANSVFISETGAVVGNCELSANEDKMAFVMYGGGSGVTASMNFYSPTNTANVATNYRCNGVSWIRGNGTFKATRFRVLTQGTTVNDKIYSDVASGDIDLMDAAYFTGIAAPSSSSVPSYHASSQVYNTTNASIIYAQIPNSAGVMKNCIIKVKEFSVNSTVGNSTIKFDIYIQK